MNYALGCGPATSCPVWKQLALTSIECNVHSVSRLSLLPLHSLSTSSSSSSMNSCSLFSSVPAQTLQRREGFVAGSAVTENGIVSSPVVCVSVSLSLSCPLFLDSLWVAGCLCHAGRSRWGSFCVRSCREFKRMFWIIGLV